MNPNYPQGGTVPQSNPSYPMAQLNGSAYAAPLNYNQPTEVIGGYDAKINPMTGQEIPDVNFAGGGRVGSEAGLASLLASRGRGGDSMLVHMNPEEVKGLQALALAHGGSLTVNPDTGLVEANFLKKLLPTIAGFTLNSLFPGLGTVGTSLAVAGVTGLAEGSFSKGLKAGLGAYSGASIREALSRVAAEKAARESLETLGSAKAVAAQEVGKEALGLTKEAVELPAQSVRGLQIPAMKLAAPSMTMPGLSRETIRGLASAAGEAAVSARPSFGQLGQGLRSLTQRGGLENFVSALGGPTKAGFIMSPITTAIEEAELEEQQRAMRRAQGSDEFPYYIPGAFDFNTGTFGQGYYRTKSGKPYTPKPFGFAEGGEIDKALPMPGSVAVTPEAGFPQAKDVRRQITDQYIADLNARLARGVPPYKEPEGPIMPPWGGLPIAPPTPPAPPITPPFRPAPIAGPPNKQPVDDVIVTPPIEPEIIDYFPIYTPPPYIYYPEPEKEKDKTPSTTIEVDPGNIIDEPMPGYPTIPMVPFTNITPSPAPTKGEVSIAPDIGGVGDLPPRLGIEELYRGVPIYVPEPKIPLTTKIDDIGMDPNIAKNLEAQSKEEGKEENRSLAEKALDFAEAGGGGIGALIGAGRELFGGDTSLRDLIEAAARGYIPDYIETPATKALAYIDKVLSPEEAAQLDAENAAAEEAKAKEASRSMGGGGGGGDLGMDYGGPTNYFDNSLQNFLDRFYMDQMMNSDRGSNWAGGVFDMAGNQIGLRAGGSVPHYASGGIGALPQYRAGGKYLQGPGDGMSDDIKANIDGRQEARLADGEFVIPADVVSHLGNGSSNAGAKKLHQMMARVREARTGKKKQAPAVKVDRYLPA